MESKVNARRLRYTHIRSGNNAERSTVWLSEIEVGLGHGAMITGSAAYETYERFLAKATHTLDKRQL